MGLVPVLMALVTMFLWTKVYELFCQLRGAVVACKAHPTQPRPLSWHPEPEVPPQPAGPATVEFYPVDPLSRGMAERLKGWNMVCLPYQDQDSPYLGNWERVRLFTQYLLYDWFSRALTHIGGRARVQAAQLYPAWSRRWQQQQKQERLWTSLKYSFISSSLLSLCQSQTSTGIWWSGGRCSEQNEQNRFTDVSSWNLGRNWQQYCPRLRYGQETGNIVNWIQPSASEVIPTYMYIMTHLFLMYKRKVYICIIASVLYRNPQC